MLNEMTRTAILLFFLPIAAQALTFDCSRVHIDDVDFNFQKLGGPRTVSWIEDQPPSISNTTFTIDLCRPLQKDSALDKDEQCPTGTRVCAVERDHNTVENTTSVRRVIAIAGDYTTSNGRSMDPHVQRLKNGASNSDSDQEGLILELNGGKYPDTRTGRMQRAIIQLECDHNRTGTEELQDTDGKSRILNDGDQQKDDDGEDGNGDKGDKDEDRDRSLRFISYKAEDKVDVLRLTWRTKYACESAVNQPDGDSSSGYGFFGWMFIIVFLGAAAYLIFGSWLNYTRYGARGWDLVPHGDTIRDMPYIVKDWSKSVIDTVQGRGFRGGYSAV